MSDAGLVRIYVGHCTKHANTYVLLYEEEAFSALTKMSEYENSTKRSYFTININALANIKEHWAIFPLHFLIFLNVSL